MRNCSWSAQLRPSSSSRPRFALAAGTSALIWCSAYTPCAAQIALDGSLGPKQALQGPNFTIDSKQGQVRGTNLFHSFGVFHVQQGESATFTNSLSSPIANVLSRVTGGERSVINGLVASTIPGANLYLINPSGFVFGPNAALSVPAAFHVSTADYLRLADGATFHAQLQNNSVLTSAHPAAFGFLRQSPASISFDRSTLVMAPGQTLSVIAGDIAITGSLLQAPGGRLNFASVASPGEVVPNVPGAAPDIDVRSFSRLGSIELTQATNATVSSARGAGTLVIRGGRLLVDSDAEVNANTSGAGNGAPVGIDIAASGQVVLTNGGGVFASTTSTGNSGAIRITAGDRVQLNDGGVINTLVNNTGGGGGLNVVTGKLEIVDGGQVFTGSRGAMSAPHIGIDAKHVLISAKPADRSTGIFSQAISGTGNGGDITLRADSMTISGVNTQNATHGISASTTAPGRGGNITVDLGGDLSITGSANPTGFVGIFGNSFGTGKAGHVQVTSGNVRMAEHAIISASSFGPGDAGSVAVTTGELDIRSGSSVFSNSLSGSGRSGALTVAADRIAITGFREGNAPMTSLFEFTGLSTTTGVTGKRGGDMTLKAGSILLTDKGAIASVSAGAGDAGSVNIEAGDLTIQNQALIASSAFGTARGGNIDVRASNVTVTGAGAPLGPEDNTVSAIASQARQAGGSAGDIFIRTNTLNVLDGAKITTETFGPGKAGDITVEAGRLRVAGTNNALQAHLDTLGAHPLSARSAILSNSQRFLVGDRATGAAGTIRITGGDVQFDGGTLASATDTPGAGGSIALSVDTLMLNAGALISAESSTSPNAGKAGDISVNARGPIQISASTIATAAETAAGGDIALRGSNVQLERDALISARSSGAGTAGSISIAADDAVRLRGSIVSTEARQSDGGNITIIAPAMVHLVDSKLSTSVGSGEGRGGNIRIDPEFVILHRSEIRADAFGGPGGNISIAADVFLADSSMLSASSALSAPGTVDIDARITDVGGDVARLPESITPATALLRASCAARLSGGVVSSLVVAGSEGLPPSPEGFLPSPMVLERGAPIARVGDAPGPNGFLQHPLVVSSRACSGFSYR